MIGVTVNSELITASFLQSVWRSQRVRRQIERGARTTSGIHKVNQRVLSSVDFPLPPLNFQRRFATIIESIEKQKDCLRTHLAVLDTLFASLQQRAFNGEMSA